jgi:predicted GIY-YIG superfamily endonuclease
MLLNRGRIAEGHGSFKPDFSRSSRSHAPGKTQPRASYRIISFRMKGNLALSFKMKDNRNMIVYLLHFHQKYPGGRGGTKQHYIGMAKHLPTRLAQHGTSKGARFMQVVAEAGIGWDCVRTWYVATPEEARALEIKLKDHTEHALICPLCRPARLAAKRTYQQQRSRKHQEETYGNRRPTENHRSASDHHTTTLHRSCC